MTFRLLSHLRVLASFVLILMGASTTFAQAPDSGAAAAQPPGQQPSRERPTVFFPMADQPHMEMHHHGQIPEVMPHFPQLGDSQRVVSGPIYQLEELERMAIASNPTLAQAQRAIEAARGRELQVGLYPNPVVGYSGEEIRGGSYGGGEQGFFVEQPIILGGKLGLDRKIGAAEVKMRQAEAEAQRQRVENDVRTMYYHVLAAQERLAIQRDLVAIAQTMVRIVHQLGNVGQADETEILEAESEEQRLEINAGITEHRLRRQWSMLVSVIGAPSLPEGGVAGRIDAEQPPLDEGRMLASLLDQSPIVQSAHDGVERAEAAVVRAKRESAPDLTLRGGLQQNYELLAAPSGRKVGLQGFAEIGVHLHIWDRNQGGIAAETAELEGARNEVRRVELMLRDRLAIYVEDYSSARLTAERYRTEILPRLERAYKLMTEQYGVMTASFIRVLMLQRMLYENETAYVDALEQSWTSSVAIQGFLLEGALMPRTSMETQTPGSGIEHRWSIGENSRILGWPTNLVSR